MINKDNGAINIGDNTIVNKDYTFEKFKESKFYKNQDGIRIIDLDEVQLIGGKKYVVSLFFRDSVIYMVSLINCDKKIPYENEYIRKSIHDNILEEMNIKSGDVFNWGKIVSEYDKRSGISSINIYYN